MINVITVLVKIKIVNHVVEDTYIKQIHKNVMKDVLLKLLKWIKQLVRIVKKVVLFVKIITIVLCVRMDFIIALRMNVNHAKIFFLIVKIVLKI